MAKTWKMWKQRAAWCRMDCYITGKLKFQRRPKSYWITTRASLNFPLQFSSLDNQPIIQYFSPTCWKTEALADGIIQKEITKHTRCTLENQTACKPKKEFQHDVPLPGSDFQVSRGNSTMTWIIEISQSTMSSYKTTLGRNQEIFNFPCIFGLRDGGAGNGMKLLRVFRVVRVARLLRTLAMDEMLKVFGRVQLCLFGVYIWSNYSDLSHDRFPPNGGLAKGNILIWQDTLIHVSVIGICVRYIGDAILSLYEQIIYWFFQYNSIHIYIHVFLS